MRVNRRTVLHTGLMTAGAMILPSRGTATASPLVAVIESGKSRRSPSLVLATPQWFDQPVDLRTRATMAGAEPIYGALGAATTSPSRSTRRPPKAKRAVVIVDVGNDVIGFGPETVRLRWRSNRANSPWHALYRASNRMEEFKIYATEGGKLLAQLLDRCNANVTPIQNEEESVQVWSNYYYFIYLGPSREVYLTERGKLRTREIDLTSTEAQDAFVLGNGNGFTFTTLVDQPLFVPDEIRNDPSLRAALRRLMRKEPYCDPLARFSYEDLFDHLP